MTGKKLAHSVNMTEKNKILHSRCKIMPITTEMTETLHPNSDIRPKLPGKK